jgi:hypothetical protein
VEDRTRPLLLPGQMRVKKICYLLAPVRPVDRIANRFRVVSQAVQTFVQLDIGPPGIGYEGQRNAQIWPVRNGMSNFTAPEESLGRSKHPSVTNEADWSTLA